MFTGIVQSLGTLLAANPTSAGKRLLIAPGELAAAPMSPGDSVCVSGVCLTLISREPTTFSFDVITETLNRTTLGTKKTGDRLNLELSLRGDSFVGGHFVQGHVDAVAIVSSLKTDPRDYRITFQVPPASIPCIVPKGSVTVDGVSMTIADTATDKFTLAIIPTTLEKTTLSALRVGDPVNVETDILARTVIHFLQQMQGGAPGAPPSKILVSRDPHKESLTMAKLQELGFA